MTNETTNSNITNSNITPELIDGCAKTMVLFFDLYKKYNVKCDETFIDECLLKLRGKIAPYTKMNDEELNTVKFKIMSNMNVDIDQH